MPTTFKSKKELTTLSEKELDKELADITKLLSGIRFENGQGLLKDTSQLKKSKKHVARIKTLQKQRLKKAA